MRGERRDRRVFPRFPVGEDVEREIRAHVELCTEELVAAGWDPEEARAEAVRRFGDQARVARRCRAITRRHERIVRRGRMMESVMQDLRYAARVLAKSPGFSLVAILILALGIGANATVFSIVDGVLLEPLPYDRPEELVWVEERMESGSGNWVTWPNYRDWREETRSLQGLTAFNAWSTTVLGGNRPAYARVGVVSRDFWRVFPNTPLAGRLTQEEDHREGAAPVAVVSQSFARDVLDGQSVPGAVIELTGVRFQVVGVVPGSFDFPSGAQIWIPAEQTSPSGSRTAHNWRAAGRLHDGLDPEDAFLELDPLTRRLTAQETEEWGAEWLAEGVIVTPLRDEIVGDTDRPLVLLMGAAVFVLLVACTNLASTLLARGTTRAREVAVRSAMGADRRRIVRQFLSEALLLAALGGAAGLALTLLALRLIQATGSDSIPRLEGVAIDGTVVLFTLTTTLLTALAFGLYPALRNREADQARTLRSEGRGSEGYKGRVWGTLVAAEVALALVLLTGSALLMRSFTAVLSQDAGFHGDDVALSPVALSGIKYPELDNHRLFWEEMLERAQAIPGVSAAGLTSSLPLAGIVPHGQLSLDGDVSLQGNANYVVASEGVFDALDITLLQGRVWDERDGPDAAHTVLVSRSFVDRYWPGEDPIGRQVSGGGMDSDFPFDPPIFGTVVGVVEDVRFRSLTREGRPTVYWYYRQRPGRIRYGASLVTESVSGDPALVAGGLREAIQAADPDVAIRVRYLSELVTGSMAERRFTLLIMSGFGMIALLLAALGIYGVVSYAVARRSREMGIRLALGATRGGVKGMVLRGAMGPVALGLLIGVIGALALSRIMTGLLFEVVPHDPVSLAGAVALLLAVGLAASWIPSHRGTRVDPVITMREE